MSIEVMSLVISRKVGSPTRKAVLMVMADAANPDGSRVFLSKPTIARRCEVSPDTVSRSIKKMLSDGLLIQAEKSKKITNGYVPIYHLNLPQIRALETTTKPVEIDTPQFAGGGTVHPDTPAQCTLTPPHSAPQTVLEPSFNTTVVSASDKTIPQLISEAVGNAIDPRSSCMAFMGDIISWIQGDNPCDLHLDLLPTLRLLSEKKEPRSIKSWSYFRNAVFEARDRRLSIPANPAPQMRTQNAKSNYSTPQSRAQKRFDIENAAAEAAIRSFESRQA